MPYSLACWLAGIGWTLAILFLCAWHSAHQSLMGLYREVMDLEVRLGEASIGGETL